MRRLLIAAILLAIGVPVLLGLVWLAFVLVPYIVQALAFLIAIYMLLGLIGGAAVIVLHILGSTK